MNTKPSLYRIGAAVATALWLAGCVPQETRPTPPPGPFAELYDGEKGLTYGTEFPAASAVEAEARGDRALTQNDTDRALYLYVQALELDPKAYTALYKVGLIHRSRNNAPMAERAFRMVLKLQPEHAGALEAVGLILLDKREYAAAGDFLKQALAHDPKRWQSHSALGVIADLNRDHEEAVNQYRQALALRPESVQLLNNLGYSQYLAGAWDEALKSLQQAVALDPNFRLGWQNLGLVHTRAGRYPAAVEAFQHAGSEAAAYNNVGYLCMMDGHYDEAASYLLHAIDLSPTHYTLAHKNLEHLQHLRGARLPTEGGVP